MKLRDELNDKSILIKLMYDYFMLKISSRVASRETTESPQLQLAELILVHISN